MNRKRTRIEAVVLAIVLLGAIFLVPASSIDQVADVSEPISIDAISTDRYDEDETMEDTGEPVFLDTIYTPEEDVSFAGEQNDIGYNIDVGDRIQKAIPLYVGEPVDQTVPGRGREGSLDPDRGDSDDWYRFSMCKGQTIDGSLSSGENYDFEFADHAGNPVGQSYTATETGIHFLHIFAIEGAGAGGYTFSVTLSGQNDADTGGDAGDGIGQATPITPGSYTGYMDFNDREDWYSFSVSSGQGIFVYVEPLEKSDYDIHLYNPAGELVHSAQYYGEDELEYPADVSGKWAIKLDMFPGWDKEKWPDNYFLYSSGAYKLRLSIGGEAEAPPGPIPQPDITPVAQTFIVDDDPGSNRDEYGYIAAVPAANYIKEGKRYVSPIVYRGVDYIPTWFTTVDQTTQYLLDDWNTYLARHDMVAKEYIIPEDPIEAAAFIATSKWTSSRTAVVAVDGSVFQDEVSTIIDKDASLSSSPDITRVKPGEFKDVAGLQAYPMFLGKKWGAIHLVALGDDFSGDTGIITPRYEAIMEDWWPHPYDFNGYDMDTFFPIVTGGLWWPYVTSESGLEELQIIKYAGDRYTIPVTTTDCSIKVTVSTTEESNLIVYLVDPEYCIRRPSVPHYNGGEIKPIHTWLGGHWEQDYDEYRTWIIEPHTEYTVEVHYPMEGKWTAIVVPYLDKEKGDIGFSGPYHITVEIRKHNPKRIAAALSAANGAVIASMKNAPLLYVTEDSVPSETSDALTKLGVTEVIFVNIDGVSKASISGATEYKTMKEVIDAIKADPNSENFVTITSLGTGDGYFAPAAMAAAYHVSPVLNIGEAAEAYDVLDKAATWREYGGDYYHGSRSLGHLPHLNEPFDLKKAIEDFLKEQKFPPPGFDLKRRWYCAIHDGIHKMVADYGLDLVGKEAYLFVADRDTDIRDLVCRAMTGNNSYAGHIPVPTAAFSSAHIVRNVLYPAIIYANPGRDVTTSQMMNFPDGWLWTTNDGERHAVFSSRVLKKSFSSHGRFYEGHCVWDNLLERYNTGAAICYYSGHGTGGSGISAQYRNVNEQFPLNEMRHEHLKDFDWWDAWRGYHYDDKQTKTARWGGFTWYNAKEPNLYDIIHFKWVDQLFENLHSLWDLWMSCTTQAHLGPIVYLSHGAAICYGNAGTGLCPQEDLLDDSWMTDVLVHGLSIGEAFSKYVWLHQRDYTTCDPTAMYGSSSNAVTNVQVIFGDPTQILYSPEWTEPVPVEA